MRRNPNMEKLNSNYLFREVALRKKKYLENHPHAKLISLGIGDTTSPIPKTIASALQSYAHGLGTSEGYSGYGSEQGSIPLLENIARRIYNNHITPDEIFISDGAKCDLGRLQILFGANASIAVQDPAYPVYLDGSLIQGVNIITLMHCLPENQFFPELDRVPRTDLIYFCSPNNPTGATATYDQLANLVAFAIKNRSIIIFDAAYSHFITDPSLPKSIYEIPGARQVAIEVGSFSKIAGFTGVRLGWSVVPHELQFDDGTSVRNDWHRLTSTIFNGASNIAQHGGNATLGDEGWKEVLNLTQYYMQNATLIRQALISKGIQVYGGQHAPYLWAYFPGQNSWELFQHFLEKYQILTTPGAGFGTSGEGFLRFTAFGHQHLVKEAVERLVQH